MRTIQHIYLHEEDGVFQKDMEALLNIRRSPVSTLLRKLEKDGLILRVAVPQDARQRRLLLTEKGRGISEEVERITHRIEGYLEEILTEEEQEFFARILKKVAENMDLLTGDLSNRPEVREAMKEDNQK